MTRAISLADLSPPAQALATTCLQWCDQWWDDDRGLPWGPPGHEGVDGPNHMHILPQAGWHAVGLLLRDADTDRERALRIVDEVCALQYDEPGTDWHGSYPIMAETPHPPPKATMWEHYDPNWRQFLGLSWVTLLTRFRSALPDVTVDRLERAIRLGVEGEPPERCPASYSNIALKRVAFESAAGGLLDEPAWVERAEDLMAAVARLHDRSGAFEEFNSPTYAGVDLFALSIARQHSPSAAIKDTASRLEGELWHSIGDLYHPRLGNLCAPYTRAYGMDMHQYVAKVMLSLQLVAPDIAPDPGFDEELRHGHDLFAGAITALLGTEIPASALDRLRDPTPHTVTQQISKSRRATAWLGDDMMIGAESCEADLSFWEQYVAAALHWEQPDGSIGWISVRMPGPSTATAAEGRLDVPSNGDGAATVLVGGVDDARPPSGGVWRLPGLDLDISADLEPAGTGPFQSTGFLAPGGHDVHLARR